VDKKLLDHKLTLSSINLSTQNQILTQISLLDENLSPAFIEEIKNILFQDAVFNHRTIFISGFTELTLFIQEYCHDNKLTFSLLQSINSILKLNRFNDLISIIKNDVLIINYLLCINEPLLIESLNSFEFDLFDIYEIFYLFYPSCFAATKGKYFTMKMIDILLFDKEAINYLFAPFYGLLIVKKKEILEQNVETIFDFLIDLPVTSSQKEIDEAFRIGYNFIRKQNDLITQEKSKRNWTNILEIQGIVLFHKDAGLTIVNNKNESNIGENEQLNQINQTKHDKSDSGSMTFDLKDLSMDNNNNDQAKQLNDSNNKNISSSSNIIISPNINNNDSSTSSTSDSSLITRLLDAEQNKINPSQLTELIHSARQQLEFYQQKEKEKEKTTHQRQASASIITAFTSATTSPIYSTENSVNERNTNNNNNDLQIPSSSSTNNPSSTSSSSRFPSTPLIKYSDINDYQSFPCLYMRGYLLKSRQASKFYSKHTVNKSTLSNLFGSNLTRRYFILNGSFLTYFKSHTQLKPSRDESLDIRQCQIEEINEKNFEQFGFGFEIKIKIKNEKNNKKDKKDKNNINNNNNNEQYEPLLVLFASNENDRKTWVHLLKLTTGQVAGLNQFLPSPI